MSQVEKNAKNSDGNEKTRDNNSFVQLIIDVILVGIFSLLIYYLLSPLGTPEPVMMAVVIIFGVLSSRHRVLIYWPIVLLKKLFRK